MGGRRLPQLRLDWERGSPELCGTPKLLHSFLWLDDVFELFQLGVFRTEQPLRRGFSCCPQAPHPAPAHAGPPSALSCPQALSWSQRRGGCVRAAHAAGSDQWSRGGVRMPAASPPPWQRQKQAAFKASSSASCRARPRQPRCAGHEARLGSTPSRGLWESHGKGWPHGLPGHKPYGPARNPAFWEQGGLPAGADPAGLAQPRVAPGPPAVCACQEPFRCPALPLHVPHGRGKVGFVPLCTQAAAGGGGQEGSEDARKPVLVSISKTVPVRSPTKLTFSNKEGLC